MIKTHLIRTNAEKFQESVNEFIADKKVIDIKYQVFTVNTGYTAGGIPTRTNVFDSALIIYEENE